MSEEDNKKKEPEEAWVPYDKKVVFSTSHQIHANLRLRLLHDGISQAKFFRGCIAAYLSGDPDFEVFFESFKEKNARKNVKSKRRRTASQKLKNEGKSLMKDFALTEEEVENIFDLLEQEFPDL